MQPPPPPQAPQRPQHAGAGAGLGQHWVNLPVYVALLAAITTLLVKNAVHQVPEGHVGLYWRGGKLLSWVTPPGMHMRMPFIDVYEPIQVTMQTDKVTDIPCGTKGGVNITFEKIEVVNRLTPSHVHATIKEYGVDYDKTWIYDKIHHEINQFCSSHSLQEVYIDKFDQVDERLQAALQAGCDRYAPGIEIISVRITKPRIPSAIMDNYVEMENQRTRALVAAERHKVALLEAQTERQKAVAEAEQQAETSAILMKQRIAEAEARLAEQQIQTRLVQAREKGLADAAAYATRARAKANQELLTPEYLQQQYIQALGASSKVYFGDNIPKMLADNWLGAGQLQRGQAQAGGVAAARDAAEGASQQ